METRAKALPVAGVTLALDTLVSVVAALNEEVSTLGADLESVMRDSNPPCDVVQEAQDRSSVCAIADTINTAIGSLKNSLEMMRNFRSRLDL